MQTWKPHGVNSMDNPTKERINREWRPKDDGGGGGGNQPQPQQPQDCEGEQESQQSGGEQPSDQQGDPQQGGGGSGQNDGGQKPQEAPSNGGQPQAQQGQGGQPSQQQGSPSGGGGNQAGFNPASGAAQQGARRAPTREEMKEARKKRQEEQKKKQDKMKSLAEAEGKSVKEVQSQVSSSRKPKTDWWEVFKRRKEFREHNKGVIDYETKDHDYTRAEIEYGDNPTENAEKYLQKLRELNERDDVNYTEAGWSGQEGNPAGEDQRASEKDLERSSLAQNMKNNHDRADAVFDPATGESIRKLNNSFSVLASKIAEDAVSWPTIGDDEWDVHALMKRKYDKRPLTHCKQSREKSRLVLVLDTSGSCRKYSEFFQAIAQAALAFGDVEIYEAPNGYITHKLIPDEGWLRVSAEGAIDWGLQSRHVVFFGDWDGAARVIHNSQSNKMYWFDCELRRDADHWLNQWVGEFGYTYTHFKGKRYNCYNVQDFMRLVKKIK